MIDLIAGLIILAILGGAVGYIVRAKRKGVKCISCPVSDCPSKDSKTCCCTCTMDVKIEDPELSSK